MDLTVNGKKTQTPDGLSVTALLESLDIGTDAGGIAVAVNDSVVPRDRWDDVTLADGDRIEVIHAVQGG